MAKDMERRPTAGVEKVPMRRRVDIFAPWFENFMRPFEDWFDEPILGRSFDTKMAQPNLDIDETDKEFIICADLPGVSKNDIRVDASGNQITLLAVRHWDKKARRSQEQGEQT